MHQDYVLDFDIRDLKAHNVYLYQNKFLQKSHIICNLIAPNIKNIAIYYLAKNAQNVVVFKSFTRWEAANTIIVEPALFRSAYNAVNEVLNYLSMSSFRKGIVVSIIIRNESLLNEFQVAIEGFHHTDEVQLNLVTDSAALCEKYPKIIKSLIDIPNINEGCYKTKKSKKQINIGILGSPRREKGIYCILSAIKRCKNFKVKFFIQIHDAPNRIKCDIMSAKNRNLSIIRYALPLKDYKKLINQLDYFLVGNNPSKYKYRTSSIINDALNYNKKMIIKSGAISKYNLKKQNSNTISYKNIQSLSNILNRLK